MVKEVEAAAVEGEAVDFSEVDADRKDETTLRDAVPEEVLVPARGHHILPWSLRPPTCEPELWLMEARPPRER